MQKTQLQLDLLKIVLSMKVRLDALLYQQDLQFQMLCKRHLRLLTAAFMWTNGHFQSLDNE